MAASAVNRRYISAVYEDKYFPEKNAAIPFKWETSPGRPRYDTDDDVDDYFEINATKDDDKQGSCLHQCMQESCIHTRHPHTTIYPLRPPPKATPALSPLRVKDLLVDGGMCANDLSDFDDDDDDDQLQQLPPHAARPDLHTHRRRSFSRLSILFRSVKASTVVPIHKHHCAIKQPCNLGVDGSQASRLVTHAPFRGRSQSFNHAAMHGASAAAKQGATNGIDAVGNASIQVPGRRCNSFHLQSACHTGHHACKKEEVDDVDDDDPSSMAVAAVWAGACILAAAAAHDVVTADHHHHHHAPCRVAMKLIDLMQQSANFSELELPMMKMMKLKKGGGSVTDESFAQLSLCAATTPQAAVAWRKPNSLEEEVMEAFLSEGINKSCTHDDDIVEDESTKKEKATLEFIGDDHSCKLVKRKSFFKVFKNECIACWCPTSTL